MGKTARNAIKGYTYQQSVFALFLSIMDTERNIAKITVEKLDTKNFDDIHLECTQDVCCDKKSYHIQAKNYPNTAITDISITDHVLRIKGNDNEFDPTDNNILILNTTQIVGTDIFMGLPCRKFNDVIIIPLTPEQIADRMDEMFYSEAREIQIVHVANNIVQNAKFEITIEELPDLIEMSTDLEHKTIILRKIPSRFDRTITYIEGKPGVGKSHFVDEVCEEYNDAIIYRFWIGSQDPNRNRRIRFETFISELGIKVYRSSKRVKIQELVDYIQNEDLLVIIDGLDHVENYNPQELELFIDFIDKLKNSRTVVLSRPLRHEISWKKNTLLDWNIDETQVYLEMAHGISDYQAQKQIFDISGGYPIITYFLAEDFNINHNINLSSPISEINDYYDTLFVYDKKPSVAIGVFASGNCFFTWKELESFFSEPEMYEIICEFIKNHPYLFKIIQNRISLIHDSFNTYLRTRIKSFAQRKKKTIAIIRESLLSGSIEYMARMDSFEFDDEFYLAMLKKYSNANSLTELMLSTRDYNSITNLYVQLQRLLEDKFGVLDIYEYYSFALLFQVATRNDLIGNDSLVYQMLLYIRSHEDIENSIFSSDYIWQVYLVCCGKEKYTEQYLTNRHMSDSQFYDLIDHLNEDNAFYNKKNEIITYNELNAQLNDANTDKQTVLINYLISVYIHGNTGDPYFDLFMAYISGDRECSINALLNEMSQYDMNKFWVKYSLSKAEYHLHELGLFDKNNKFRNSSLHKLITENAYMGSFEVVTLAASYLKLANHEQREVDISSLAYCWSMYYNRKDYSVLTIDKALLAFEKKNLVNWEQSFFIIDKLLDQSEKGIRHLLTSYVNQKGVASVSYLNKIGYFNGGISNVDFWELDPVNYKCFTDEEVVKQVMQLLGAHYYSKTIKYCDISNILNSDHRDLVLYGLRHFDYAIESPDEDLIPTIERMEVKYTERTEEKEPKYVPLRHGTISERDFEYISEQNIGYLEISRYADGWYTCLPFVSVFSIYPKKNIQQDYISIIHNAMFARVPDSNYIGNWYNLIGHIPELLLQFDIDVDWKKIYDVFNAFLDLSLIRRDYSQNIYSINK